uniref:5-formyltetrahydrofolate cyclo-ligase n=1 Tax=Rhizophora mucronata TaxID=61149 RepID=A0A2P2QL58_RHIMU
MWRLAGYRQAVNPQFSFTHIYTSFPINWSKARPLFALPQPTRLPTGQHSAKHCRRRRFFAMSNDSRNQDPTKTTQLDEIFKQKRILRSRIRKALRSMDPSLRSKEDDAIQNLVLEASWFKSSQRLCAYISCSALREVDTSRLLSEILQNPAKDGGTQIAKKLYVPRVEDRNSNMRMLNISCLNDLIANSMDILEPALVDRDGNLREDGELIDRNCSFFYQRQN